MPNLFFKQNETTVTKAVGIDFPIANVPKDCKVYLFYFPGFTRYEGLEKALKDWGAVTKNNLFVGFMDQGDLNYQLLRNNFELVSMPAIVVTGYPQGASIEEKGYWNTAYQRLDDKVLMANTARMMECLERSYNLFLGGSVEEALKQAQKEQKLLKYGSYLRKLKDAFGSIDRFLDEHSIEVGLAQGVFKMSPAGKDGSKPA